MSAVYMKVMDILQNKIKFERVLSKMKIILLENGTCLAEMKIEEEHTNPFGTLHGGLCSTLVDVVSGFAILSHPKVDYTSWPVSITLQTNFIRSAKQEDVIEIIARTVHVGKKIGLLQVDIKNKESKSLIAKGFHTLMIISHESANKLKL